jgi:hypothetical protein
MKNNRQSPAKPTNREQLRTLIAQRECGFPRGLTELLVA